MVTSGPPAAGFFHYKARLNVLCFDNCLSTGILYLSLRTPKIEGRIEMQCPKCKHDEIERSKRRGFLERGIYTIFGYFPWRCDGCGKRFFLRVRYKRKIRLQPRT